MLAEFYKLYDTNQDIRGWISIPQTVINYPVVQTSDNDYYLHNNFNKTADYYGSLFLDYRDNINPQSQNLIIYGHNMKDGEMLTSIVNYEKTDFYKASPIITFNTIYAHYSWKVFAAFVANADPKDGYVFNYLINNFSSEDAFNSFIKEVRARSLINTPSVDVAPGDTLLTLSTCYYSSNDARFVVMARRLRPNESTSVESATRNENALSAINPMK
jgi:SrtB family sortase